MPTALEALIQAQDDAAGNLPARREPRGGRTGRPKGSLTRGLTIQSVRELGPIAVAALKEGIEGGDMNAVAIWARISVPTPRHMQAHPIPDFPANPVASPETLAQAVAAVMRAYGAGTVSADEADAALGLLAKAGKLATGLALPGPEGDDGNSEAHGALLDLIQRHAEPAADFNPSPEHEA